MATLVLESHVENRILAERKATGGDRYDEVWDEVYIMSPMANNEHQDLAIEFATIFRMTLDWTGLGHVYAGVNVTDREDDWTKNYRVPDVAVFLTGCPARNMHTHWLGGPDFAVEIVSEDDRTREKFDFYARVGVRELLLVDRDPWAVELHRLDSQTKEFHLIGRSTPESPDTLVSAVLPFQFQLQPGEPRPRIEVQRTDGSERWLI
ncbi:MAG: Uma2 family endonuclease [Planctomycetales bacterium]|nr:Uma2 family endonuclease [Planctomycetales bacterium]